ncbi:EAL domain-containing protein [Methylomonas methanica]|uniref:EAL domain-containing protein n=1 Tax=Methylomonas methanica TaxID=421 RepID=UPI002F91370F
MILPFLSCLLLVYEASLTVLEFQLGPREMVLVLANVGLAGSRIALPATAILSAINPSNLKLELTESLVLDDIDNTILKMHSLREIGIRFSMDDFGTGYSSLSSLRKLPLYQLKIDQSFVRDITTDPDDAVIVQTIIAMAMSLGMEVIAEGVETEEQRVFLELHGCHAIQGYLFGRPMPLDEFERLLASTLSTSKQ